MEMEKAEATKHDNGKPRMDLIEYPSFITQMLEEIDTRGICEIEVFRVDEHSSYYVTTRFHDFGVNHSTIHCLDAAMQNTEEGEREYERVKKEIVQQIALMEQRMGKSLL
jgi:hypothetical protein